MEEKTTIEVGKDTRDDLMLFKIKSKAKNIDEVLKKAIKLLKINKEDKK